MKNSSETQPILEFPITPPLRSSPLKKGTVERMRDSEGRFTSDDNEKISDIVERVKIENEMITRKYLAVVKLLASAEREILKYKNIDL